MSIEFDVIIEIHMASTVNKWLRPGEAHIAPKNTMPVLSIEIPRSYDLMRPHHAPKTLKYFDRGEQAIDFLNHLHDSVCSNTKATCNEVYIKSSGQYASKDLRNWEANYVPNVTQSHRHLFWFQGTLC